MAAHGTKRTIQLCVATSATHPKGTLRALEGDGQRSAGAPILGQFGTRSANVKGRDRAGQFLSGAQAANVYAHAHASRSSPRVMRTANTWTLVAGPLQARKGSGPSELAICSTPEMRRASALADAPDFVVSSAAAKVAHADHRNPLLQPWAGSRAPCQCGARPNPRPRNASLHSRSALPPWAGGRAALA